VHGCWIGLSAVRSQRITAQLKWVRLRGVIVLAVIDTATLPSLIIRHAASHEPFIRHAKAITRHEDDVIDPAIPTAGALRSQQDLAPWLQHRIGARITIAPVIDWLILRHPGHGEGHLISVEIARATDSHGGEFMVWRPERGRVGLGQLTRWQGVTVEPGHGNLVGRETALPILHDELETVKVGVALWASDLLLKNALPPPTTIGSWADVAATSPLLVEVEGACHCKNLGHHAIRSNKG
jgi:hypothetical protein